MAAPKINVDLLARWVDLDAQRKDLERRARTLGRDQEMLSETLDAALQAAGVDKARRGEYLVQYVAGRVSVSWRDEFLREVGPAKAAEIQAAAAAQPPPRKIQVLREQTSAPAAA